jgi:hypothetical protein
MSSASEHASSASVPLLSGTASYGSKISGIIPCAQFLFESEPDTYYKGGIYKNQKPLAAPFTVLKQGFAKLAGFKEFFSYKFEHPIKSKLRTFCITFRKKNTASVFSDKIDNYHIRLSLIEKRDTESTYKLACKGIGESMMLKSDGTLLDMSKAIIDNKMGVADSEMGVDDSEMYVADIEQHKGDFLLNFSSITTGQYKPEIALVEGMREITEVPGYIKACVEKIINNMIILGNTLVYHCDNLYQPQQSEPQPSTSGGATRKINRLTRRRKSVFKRKGKKSYRKKKYGKTKKSRRFRRSVRSRR